MDERVRAIIMTPDESVSDVLRRMDATGSRMILVCDRDDVLLGVATDGDVRRWIIAGKSLTDRAGTAMNASPHTLREGWTRDSVERLMAEHHFECVPVLDGAGRVVDAIWWHDLVETPPAPARPSLGLPVVIMAGGMGKRLAPYTDVLPKPLVPIGEKPITQLIMDRFAEWGCDRFFLMLNHKANLIRAYFEDLDVPYGIESVVEEEPLGTAGALSLLRGRMAQTFFLTNCDILVDADYADVLRFHRDAGNDITLVASMKHFTIPYGVCEVGERGQLVGMTEKPAFDRLVGTGMYVVEPRTLEDVPAGTFYHMTDLVDAALKKGRPVGAYPVSEGSWLDMGALDEMEVMLKKLGVPRHG